MPLSQTKHVVITHLYYKILSSYSKFSSGRKHFVIGFLKQESKNILILIQLLSHRSPIYSNNLKIESICLFHTGPWNKDELFIKSQKILN
jgi:hypothetical protein